jgi:type IV fimbrial biogenesis protein FimT
MMEVVIITAIIGLTTSLAVPNYLQWNSQRQLREAATRIQAQLALARMTAMNRNITVTVGLAMAGNQVTVRTTDPNNNQLFAVETLMTHVKGFTGGPVQFSSLGLRAGGGAGAQFITVQNDKGLTYSIQVLPGGKATWCVAPAPNCGASL